MKGPVLVIRADASHLGGTGHIMRTLAIAQEWVSRGGVCYYFCATLPPLMQQRLKSENCSVVMLNQQPASDEEAEETSQHLARLNPHWLLIDSYPLTPAYQESLDLPPRTRVANISDFGVDDFAKPNLVIHANISIAADYLSLGEQATVLAGADYILLRREIICDEVKPVTKDASKLLVSMGGSDPQEAGALLCKYLIETDLIDHLKVRVVIGPAYPSDGLMYGVSHPNLESVLSPPSMKPHYHWADTAICSPSTTSLELAHYGLPIGLIVTADNQERVLEAMREMDAAILLADVRVQPDFSNIEYLLSGARRIAIAGRAADIVDGKGTQRVCEAMGLPELRFRAVTMGDAEILWEWSNDPLTRAASFDTKPIPWDDHLAWFSEQLETPTAVILIVESSENPLGVVRYNLNKEAIGEAVISINLAPEVRGRGLASLVLSRSAEYFFTRYPDQVITAWIRPENKGSHKSFIYAQYEDYPSPLYPDRIRMRLTHPTS